MSIEVPPPPPPVPEDSVGDQEALRAIKMIFHESVDKVSEWVYVRTCGCAAISISPQEAQLREREQALNIRESMLEKTQRRLFVGEQSHKLASAVYIYDRCFDVINNWRVFCRLAGRWFVF